MQLTIKAVISKYLAHNTLFTSYYANEKIVVAI